MAELFTDDMNEDELISAFKDAQAKEPEPAAEPEPAEPEPEAKAPEPEPANEPQDLNTPVPMPEPENKEMEQPEPEQSKGEADPEPEPAKDSSSDVIDFSSPVMLKDRDIELPVNNSKELLDLAHMGLNYTRKTQKLAEYKGTIDYMGQHGITMEDLQVLAETKKGNLEALGQIAKDAKLDPLLVDPEKSYQPNANFAPKQSTEVDMYLDEIEANPENSKNFLDAISYVPDSFKTTLSSDAKVLRAFNTDVKSGLAKELLPEAIKLHSIHGGDFVQSYIEAGNRYFAAKQQQEPAAQAAEPQVQSDPTPTPPSPNRAKAGVASTSSTSSNSGGFDVWSATDSEFLEKINELTNR